MRRSRAFKTSRHRPVRSAGDAAPARAAAAPANDPALRYDETARGLTPRWAAAVLLTALALRLLHVTQMRGTVFFDVLMGDSRGYDAWARTIASGDWFGHEVFYQAPLYPYFLGAIYSLSGADLLVARCVQAVIGALSCVALTYAGDRLISRRAGIAAGLMLALYPPAIFFDALIQKSVLDVFFVCLSLAFIGHISRHATAGDPMPGTTWWPWVLLGMVLGALSLTRENALLVAAVVVVWAFVRAPGSSETGPSALLGSRRIVPATFVVAGLGIVLLPVATRNYAVGGGFYLTTSQFGSNLYIGNNPRADGSYVALRQGRGSPEFERRDARELAEAAVGRALTPSEISAFWTGRTVAFIRSEPGRWLALMARKAWLLASATELIDTESLESHAEYSTALAMISPFWHFGVLLPLSVIGMWTLWADRRRLAILYALTATYAASVVIFFVVARYRLPLVPPLALFAGAGAVLVADRARAGARGLRSLAAPAAVAAAVALAANWPLYSAASQMAITENNLGTALQENGRAVEAIDRYRRALSFDPAYAPALGNLGTALRAAGRLDEAIATYRQALAGQAFNASVPFNLANALLEKGQVEEAIAAYRQAIALDERSAPAHSNLANALATRGAVAESLAHFRRSVELDPANAATLYDYGSVALEAGALEVATDALGRAVQLKPDYAEAYNNLGIALASQGKVAAAIAQWERALAIKPGFADARKNMETAGGLRP